MCWNVRVHENLSEVRMPATGRGTAQTKPRCPSSSETPWPGTLHCAAADCRPSLDLLLESSTADRKYNRLHRKEESTQRFQKEKKKGKNGNTFASSVEESGCYGEKWATGKPSRQQCYSSTNLGEGWMWHPQSTQTPKQLAVNVRKRRLLSQLEVEEVRHVNATTRASQDGSSERGA